LVHVDSSDVPPAPQLLTPIGERSHEQVSENNAGHGPGHSFEYSDQTSGNGPEHSDQVSDHISGNGSENGSDKSAEVPAAAAVTAGWGDAPEGAAHADEVADLSEVWHEDDAQLPVEDEEKVEAVAAPAPEPVNRGLLLKFLGSARN
jgi:hypothetical protein